MDKIKSLWSILPAYRNDTSDMYRQPQMKYDIYRLVCLLIYELWNR